MSRRVPERPAARSSAAQPPAAQDEIRIANRATYWPVSPIDIVVAAPLVARVLLGVSPVGRVVQGAAWGLYLGSALRDWRDRRGIRKIVFRREFGADLRHLVPMPRELREAEVRVLAERLGDELVLERVGRRELAVEVDRQLTRFIAGITGQRVHTSAEVRRFVLVGLAFPFALGACDMLSGDVAIFRDTGLLEPHVIAHEFGHRKGYWKELYAQVLAYLALASSGVPLLRQSALLERLHRNLRVLAGDDHETYDRLVARAALRRELRDVLGSLRPPRRGLERRIQGGMRRVYDARMRVTGQTGISDYDRGFTDFLYTFEISTVARQSPPPAGALHRPAAR